MTPDERTQWERDEARPSTFDRADNTARLALEVADLRRQVAAVTAERDEAREQRDGAREQRDDLCELVDQLKSELADGDGRE